MSELWLGGGSANSLALLNSWRSETATVIIKAFLTSISVQPDAPQINHMVVALHLLDEDNVQRTAFYGALRDGSAIDKNVGNPDFYPPEIIKMPPFSWFCSPNFGTETQSFTLKELCGDWPQGGVFEDYVGEPLRTILPAAREDTQLYLHLRRFPSASIGYYSLESNVSVPERLADRFLLAFLPSMAALNVLGAFHKLFTDPVASSGPDARKAIHREAALRFRQPNGANEPAVAIAGEIVARAREPLRESERFLEAQEAFHELSDALRWLDVPVEQLRQSLTPAYDIKIPTDVQKVLDDRFRGDWHEINRIDLQDLSSLEKEITDLCQKLGLAFKELAARSPVVRLVGVLAASGSSYTDPEKSIARSLLKYLYQNRDPRRGIHPPSLVLQLLWSGPLIPVKCRTRVFNPADEVCPVSFVLGAFADKWEAFATLTFAGGTEVPPAEFVTGLSDLVRVFQISPSDRVRLAKPAIESEASVEISVDLEPEPGLLKIAMKLSNAFEENQSFRFQASHTGNLGSAIYRLCHFLGIDAPMFVKTLSAQPQELLSPFSIASWSKRSSAMFRLHGDGRRR